MVYRGKPSAGCEHCRRAKKKCSLEVPACARCVKLNKQCSGYRDTTSLQIQDETQQVTRRAERKQAQSVSATPASQSGASQQPLSTPQTFEWEPRSGTELAFFEENALVTGSASPYYTQPTSNGSRSYDLPLTLQDAASTRSNPSSLENSDSDSAYVRPSFSYYLDSKTRPLARSTPAFFYNLNPAPEDIAVNFFLSCFVSKAHWNYMPKYAALPRLDPCLTLAIRACGMAALNNVQPIPRGRDWSRRKYVEALGLLNAALRDLKRARTDESLMAVTLLSLYENLTCDSPQSVQSWKAHMTGAAQLLKVRGKAQLKTMIGQNLFRETRSQIIIHCMWDDLEPPSFLRDWTPVLQAHTEHLDFIRPADDMMQIAFDYASLSSQIKTRSISNTAALEAGNIIDTRLLNWATDTQQADQRWSYTTHLVPDAPHVWNGTLHAYTGLPTPGVWNFYRSVRIMVSRTQENLSRRFSPSATERASQQSYFRSVRRGITDDICASIPCLLGQTPEGVFRSQNVLVSAYNSIWPLFFAGTCVLERCSHSIFDPPEVQKRDWGSAAQAQLNWICGRLDYISDVVGLRWARGVGNTLRGDFSVLVDMRPEFESDDEEESDDVAFTIPGPCEEERQVDVARRSAHSHAGVDQSAMVWRGRSTAGEVG